MIIDRNPNDFYSPKLNTAQEWYKTIKRQLLLAIETCKEYKNVLLVYHEPIIVSIEHKNNTINAFNASDLV
jgi:hypothetical protein